MNKQQIAEVCAKAAHEVNNVYNAVIGDPLSPPWNQLTESQCNGIIAGAMHAINGGSPEESHNIWLKTRGEEGWTYGPTKSFEKKTSPCFLPYDQLPPSQQIKDSLFQSIVRSVAKALPLD